MAGAGFNHRVLHFGQPSSTPDLKSSTCYTIYLQAGSAGLFQPKAKPQTWCRVTDDACAFLRLQFKHSCSLRWSYWGQKQHRCTWTALPGISGVSQPNPCRIYFFFFSPPGCKNPATYSPAEVWSSAARSPGGWGQEAASGKRQSRGRLLSSQRFSTDLRNLEVPCGAPGYVHKTQPPPAPWRFTPAVKFSALVPWYRATAAEGSLYVNIWCSLVRL